jgi:hypothetical protein
MSRKKRANGAGSAYLEHGCFYGRWVTLDGGRANRKLGPVRQPGTRQDLTRTQAEKRLRELMDTIEVTSDPDCTIAVAGQALLVHLEAKGCSRSHIETVESHLRVLRLVAALGADPRCLDAGRILRPPGTWNHKRRPPSPVALMRFEPAKRLSLDEVLARAPTVASSHLEQRWEPRAPRQVGADA